MGAYEPAVYSLTICVPLDVYDRMKDDPILKELDIIQNAWLDEEKQVVYICSKIGETQNFQQRVRSYKHTKKGISSNILMIILKFFLC
jgi:hypothetical protein